MKRSRSIRLVLLGAAAVTLSACGDDDEPIGGQYFADEAQCASAENGDTCRAAVAEARGRHMLTAPRFASRQQCEQEYGAANCEPVEVAQAQGQAQTTTPSNGKPDGAPQQTSTPRTGFSFIPLMTGFWLARNAAPGAMASPVYRDAQGRAFSGRSYVGTLQGRSFTADTTRGGFGGTAMARSGSGGGS